MLRASLVDQRRLAAQVAEPAVSVEYTKRIDVLDCYALLRCLGFGARCSFVVSITAIPRTEDPKTTAIWRRERFMAFRTDARGLTITTKPGVSLPPCPFNTAILAAHRPFAFSAAYRAKPGHLGLLRLSCARTEASPGTEARALAPILSEGDAKIDLALLALEPKPTAPSPSVWVKPIHSRGQPSVPTGTRGRPPISIRCLSLWCMSQSD
jgi:hypothetical protein